MTCLPTGVWSALSSTSSTLMPNRTRLHASIRPAGPAPTTQTWHSRGASGMLRSRVRRSTHSAVSFRSSLSWSSDGFSSTVAGAMVAMARWDCEEDEEAGLRGVVRGRASSGNLQATISWAGSLPSSNRRQTISTAGLSVDLLGPNTGGRKLGGGVKRTQGGDRRNWG
jgi:hypothetical protein